MSRQPVRTSSTQDRCTRVHTVRRSRCPVPWPDTRLEWTRTEWVARAFPAGFEAEHSSHQAGWMMATRSDWHDAASAHDGWTAMSLSSRDWTMFRGHEVGVWWEAQARQS